MPPRNYVWNSPAASFSVEISEDVIRALSLAAMEAFKAVPRRGLEIGGILLGETEILNGLTTVRIEGFERVESEHRSGPSYLLSESDLERLDHAIARHPRVVGVYRSHTRSEVLTVQEEDTALFRRCFGASSIFLIIQPVSGMAGIFLPKDADLQLAHEFSLRDRETWGTEVPPTQPRAPVVEIPRRAAPSILEAAAAITPPPAEAVTAPSSRVRRSREVPRWLVAGTALVAGLALAALLQLHSPNASRIRTASPPEPPVAPVSLSVERDGRALHLFWNRDSHAVRNATRATLSIQDGSHNSRLDLEPKELRVGTVSYWPETQDVQFRLDVFSPDGDSAGAIRVLGGGGAPSSPALIEAAAPLAEKPPAAPVAPPKASTPPPAKGKRSHPIVMASREAPEAPKPSPFNAVPLPKVIIPPAPTAQPPAAIHAAAPVQQAEVRSTHPVAAPPPPSPRAPDPYVSVVAEPVTGSFLRRVARKIPLFGRLKKPKEAYTPPQPRHEVEPVLDTLEQRLLTSEVPVDVKVYITESGKVDYAELLSSADGQKRAFATAAVYAARRWDFDPARVGDEKVPGEVILHFQFRPPLSAER